MSNHLSVDKVQSILHLHQQGWSQRRIATRLGVDRKAVRRHLRISEAQEQAQISSKGTSAPTGSPEPKASQSASKCAPYRSVIEQMLGQGLSAQRIYQDLQSEHGYQGGYYSVRRFVRTLRKADPEAFRRIEVEPGSEMQVDFGTGAPVIDSNGKRRKTHVFRVVLSHSRKGYSEVVFRQTTDAFLSAMENAFWEFGGVPQTVVIDNLKAAVSKADWYDPELNPKLRAFAKHYGTTILPTKPYTPRHKGKVERGVDYVQENALKGKKFSSLAEQNEHLCQWEQNVADKRIHGTTRQQVGRHFEESEKSFLIPLPVDRFANFNESRRVVSRDGHVAIEHAYYSAPPEYIGRTLWVRWDSRTVRLLDDALSTIVVHARCQAGKFQTAGEHIASTKINSIERGTAYLLRKASLIGTGATRWSEAMLADRGIEGHRVLQGLLALSHRYNCDQIEQACDIAWRHGAYQLRSIRKLIDRKVAVQQIMPFLEDHELIRPLSTYDRYVHDCIQGGLKDE